MRKARYCQNATNVANCINAKASTVYVKLEYRQLNCCDVATILIAYCMLSSY